MVASQLDEKKKSRVSSAPAATTPSIYIHICIFKYSAYICIVYSAYETNKRVRVVVQVGEQGSLGRSISDKEGRRRSGGLPPTSPGPWGDISPAPPSPPPKRRQRANSDPPRTLSATAVRRPGSSAETRSRSRFAAAAAAAVSPLRGDAVGGDQGRGERDSEGGASSGDGAVSALEEVAVAPRSDSTVYPEVMEALGLGIERSGKAFSCPSGEGEASWAGEGPSSRVVLTLPSLDSAVAAAALAAVRSDGDEDADARFEEAADGKLPLSPSYSAREMGGLVSASPTRGGRRGGGGGGSGGGDGGRLPFPLQSRLLLPGDGLALRLPAREAGMTGDERASEVVDVLRSHRGHQLLRHSPLARDGSGDCDVGVGAAGGGGMRRSRTWGALDERAVETTMTGARCESIGVGGLGGESVGGGGGCETASGAAPGGRAGGDGGDDGGAWARIARESRQGVEDAMNRTAGREESAAVAQARALLEQGLISAEELEAVVRKDQVLENYNIYAPVYILRSTEYVY